MIDGLSTQETDAVQKKRNQFSLGIALAALVVAATWVSLQSVASDRLSQAIPGKSTGLLTGIEFRRRNAEFKTRFRMGHVQGTLFAEDQFGQGFVGSSVSKASVPTRNVIQGNRVIKVRFGDDVVCSMTIHPCDGTCEVYGGQLLFQTPAGELDLWIRHNGMNSSDYFVVNAEDLSVIECLDRAIPLQHVDRSSLIKDQMSAYLDADAEGTERFLRAVYSQYRRGFNRDVLKSPST